MNKKNLNNQLLLLFKKGDEQAFEKIFSSWFNKITGFCEQFIYNREDAKNIAQEAFINLWLNRDKIKKNSGISSFLYTYSKSICLNYIRHEKVEEKYTDKALNDFETKLNQETLESLDFNSYEIIELNKLIHEEVENLTPRCHDVFTMKQYEGKTNKQIAAILNITVKSVEANMTRALKTLKSRLSEYLPAILTLLIMDCLH